MLCKICSTLVKHYAGANVMPQKFEAEYLTCEKCVYVFIKDPHWLHLAYAESITDADICLVNINFRLSIITFAIIRMFFNYKSKFLDFAGGY